MGEALNKLEEESNKTATRQEILEYLAFSTYKQGIIRVYERNIWVFVENNNRWKTFMLCFTPVLYIR
jgi:hypothetical protein